MITATKRVPFLDLAAQYRAIGGELGVAVEQVLRSGQFVLGEAVENFENEFARYCECAQAIGVSSGTSALHLALLAAGVGAGDEVVTSPMTFVATVAAILYAGAKPVFVDIDPRTWNIDPERIERAISPRTKAILPVHLHGLTADMGPILTLADRHGITVIEDAAQAHGAEWKGSRAGSMGRIGCLSFYPGKNLGACGEAGAVVTSDAAIARTVRMLRDWGQEAKYRHTLKGYNYRMDGIQGAVLSVKLRYLEGWTQARRHWAARYDAALAGKDLQIPARPLGFRHVYHVYAVCTEARDHVRSKLDQAGIATGIHYPTPVHLQPAYADLGYRAGDFPISERVARRTLSLPMFPELTAEQVDYVCEALGEALQSSR